MPTLTGPITADGALVSIRIGASQARRRNVYGQFGRRVGADVAPGWRLERSPFLTRQGGG